MTALRAGAVNSPYQHTGEQDPQATYTRCCPAEHCTISVHRKPFEPMYEKEKSPQDKSKVLSGRDAHLKPVNEVPREKVFQARRVFTCCVIWQTELETCEEGPCVCVCVCVCVCAPRVQKETSDCQFCAPNTRSGPPSIWQWLIDRKCIFLDKKQKSLKKH